MGTTGRQLRGSDRLAGRPQAGEEGRGRRRSLPQPQDAALGSSWSSCILRAFERADSVRKLSLGEERVQGVLPPHFKPTGGHQRLPEREARPARCPSAEPAHRPAVPSPDLKGPGTNPTHQAREGLRCGRGGRPSPLPSLRAGARPERPSLRRRCSLGAGDSCNHWTENVCSIDYRTLDSLKLTMPAPTRGWSSSKKGNHLPLYTL